MLFFDLITLMKKDVTPDKSKIHLATEIGDEDPLQIYFEGRFNEWQCFQTRQNFSRKYVVSLISMKSDRWLFAGVYESKGVKKLKEKQDYKYDLFEDERCSEMNGRIVVSFSRPGRQSYLLAETWSEKVKVSEIFAERITIGDFPGFKSVNLTKAELDLIVRQSLDTWRTVLSSVAGVYLISNKKTGGLYVGSATGEGGIWQRWSDYSANGHGGNVELRHLLKSEGPERSNDFSYSILEIADVHASEKDILARESHWKDVLLSRSHGLNAN